jgi:hypothetical protein
MLASALRARLAMVLLAVAGCTCQSSLQPITPTAGTAPAAARAAPVPVAIVKDAALRALTFSARSHGYTVEIALGDYFAEAMRRERAPHFREAAIVDSAAAAGACDLAGHITATAR